MNMRNRERGVSIISNEMTQEERNNLRTLETSQSRRQNYSDDTRRDPGYAPRNVRFPNFTERNGELTMNVMQCDEIEIVESIASTSTIGPVSRLGRDRRRSEERLRNDDDDDENNDFEALADIRESRV